MSSKWMWMATRVELWERWMILFCYTCIDNWSAITNCCPLCKSEFQHITCTSVYTTGSNNEEGYSLTRLKCS
ncbi:hypothetical protein GUJ93_ZPchr0007g3408 [Zizania palustris]|uniref:Uncharacterized protein n=1 Tax=Zizania palustris TaxID=103762 RepID=A0A8J5W465_ZIZPA|nr:hypothetical protein GUJ93_ZPchr0007g3408 [Zizania palustris]